MRSSHATFAKGGFDFEAGISAMHARLANGELRVYRHLTDWFSEYRMYHRKEDGLVNKINDDLMSATRILVMGIHTAREMEGGWDGFHAGEPRGSKPRMCNGLDFDLFTGRGPEAPRDPRRGPRLARGLDFDLT
jgi:hypothetical protein